MGDNVVDRVWNHIERRYTDDSDGCDCGTRIEENQSNSAGAVDASGGRADGASPEETAPEEASTDD